MLGTRITREQLKARWAFSELSAERWRTTYAAYPLEKIRQDVAFADLTPEEITHPAWIAEKSREHFVPELNRADVYECQAWTKDQHGRTYTIAELAPDRNSNIPFLSFIACPRFSETSDPRVQADRIPFETPFVQTEPVIVLPYDTINILIDGSLRSVLFMRSPIRILRYSSGFRLSLSGGGGLSAHLNSSDREPGSRGRNENGKVERLGCRWRCRNIGLVDSIIACRRHAADFFNSIDPTQIWHASCWWNSSLSKS